MPSSDGAIHVYFDFISPYGWIGAERIGVIARRFGRAVRWHPILLKVTVQETMGLPPLLETPLKGAYVHHDIRRSLRYHGLTLAETARFGFSSVTAARAVLWTRAQAPELVEPLILALYHTHWSDARDISVAATVLDAIADIGLSRADAAHAIDGEPIKQQLREEIAAAVRDGIFGSPTFVVDGEPFWGADRLPMVEAWINRGGW